MSLKSIDLSKNLSEHPDIDENKTYMARFRNRFSIGRFTNHETYGWKMYELGEALGINITEFGPDDALWECINFPEKPIRCSHTECNRECNTHCRDCSKPYCKQHLRRDLCDECNPPPKPLEVEDAPFTAVVTIYVTGIRERLGSIVLFDDETEARQHYHNLCEEQTEDQNLNDWVGTNEYEIMEGYIFIGKCEKATKKE